IDEDDRFGGGLRAVPHHAGQHGIVRDAVAWLEQVFATVERVGNLAGEQERDFPARMPARGAPRVVEARREPAFEQVNRAVETVEVGHQELVCDAFMREGERLAFVLPNDELPLSRGPLIKGTHGGIQGDSEPTESQEGWIAQPSLNLADEASAHARSGS